jgi:hypothetical protein
LSLTGIHHCTMQQHATTLAASRFWSTRVRILPAAPTGKSTLFTAATPYFALHLLMGIGRKPPRDVSCDKQAFDRAVKRGLNRHAPEKRLYDGSPLKYNALGYDAPPAAAAPDPALQAHGSLLLPWLLPPSAWPLPHTSTCIHMCAKTHVYALTNACQRFRCAHARMHNRHTHQKKKIILALLCPSLYMKYTKIRTRL